MDEAGDPAADDRQRVLQAVYGAFRDQTSGPRSASSIGGCSDAMVSDLGIWLRRMALHEPARTNSGD